MMSSEAPILAFETGESFQDWLIEQHAKHSGIWLRIFKKGSDQLTVTYAEALDIALCYGWIDGQKKPCDTQSWLQRFTPRGKRSVWSKTNIMNIERLAEAGRMQPAGLAVVDAAKSDGRWGVAYESSRTFTLQPEFIAALTKSPKAAGFFATLNKANQFSIYYHLNAAKRPETKARRLRKFIEMLEREEKLH